MSQTFTLLTSHVECILPGGIKKAISFKDFREAIDSVIEESIPDSNIFLPSNCYLFSKTGTNMKLSCFYPGEKRTIELIDRVGSRPKKHKIPFPNIIINFDLKQDNDRWVVTQAKYLCTDKKLSQLPLKRVDIGDENIWICPLPNTYSHGSMCYGRNTMPSGFTDNFRGLDWYFQFLFSTPFNTDLSIPSVKGGGVMPWIALLASKDEFPYDLLIHRS